MTTNHQKLEILNSLNSLDALQSEKVLGFIKALVPRNRPSFRHHHCKRQAMKEINQALRQTQNPF